MTRRTARFAGAAIAAAMALIYLLIGFEVVRVVDDAPVGSDIFGFGVGAALLFAMTAVVMLAVDRRALWLGLAVVQVLVAAMYFAVSVDRHPQFELWGITLRVLQAGLFAALVYLALRTPSVNPRLRGRGA